MVSRPPRGGPSAWVVHVALLAAGTLIALVLAEGIAHFAHSRRSRAREAPAGSRFLVVEPGLRWVFHPDPDAVPGVWGESRFETNSWGYRSDEWTGDAEVSILALGGSTTQCLLLDQEEAWPQLVQRRLEESQGLAVWVGNAGKSGRGMRSHVLQMEYLPPQLPRLGAVIVLAGANDLLLRLRQGDDYDPDFAETDDGRDSILRLAFHGIPRAYRTVRPARPRPFYQRTALWRLVRQALRSDPGLLAIERGTGRHLIEARLRRLAARPLLANLPDLRSALEEYRRNLERIAALARSRPVRLVLLTQPALWREDLPAELEELLWLGQSADGGYYSSGALAAGMSLYNRVTLDVCAEQRIECIDLAGLLPKDGSVFYDDLHFNEAGAERVAEIVAPRLAAGPPFSSRPSIAP